MDELNKKLAEWAELCWHEFEYENKGSTYYPLWIATCKHCGANVIGVKESAAKSKSQNGLGYDNPDFTQSLDACFKWLVPKLREKNLLIELNDMVNDWHWDIWEPKGEGTIIACEDDENPALALCLTIEKLIRLAP